MRANEPISKPERNQLRRVLNQWRVPPRQAEEILRHAVFGPGALGLDSDQMERGVAIMVDERRDSELAGLFDWRARLGDEAFAAEWETNPAPHAHVLLCPHAPEAIYAYTVRAIRPAELTRTYLLLVSKHARILSFLRQPGATIWLVPQTVALREWAKEGLGIAYEVYSRALPVGVVDAPPAGLDSALEHVGYDED